MTEEARIALVTGSSQGVGQGIALGLAEAGWDVAVNYNRFREGAEETAAQVREFGGRAWVLQADIGDSAQVRRMFGEMGEEAGGLNLLVNNAGVQTWAPLLELKEEDWDRTIRTNLKGTFVCTQRAALMMKDTVGVSSTSARVPTRLPSQISSTTAPPREVSRT